MSQQKRIYVITHWQTRRKCSQTYSCFGTVEGVDYWRYWVFENEMFRKRIFQQFSKNRVQTYKVTHKDRKDLCKEGVGYTVRELSGSWSWSVNFLGLQVPCSAGVKNKWQTQLIQVLFQEKWWEGGVVACLIFSQWPHCMSGSYQPQHVCLEIKKILPFHITKSINYYLLQKNHMWKSTYGQGN